MAGAPDDRRWQKMTDLILTIRPAPDDEADVADAAKEKSSDVPAGEQIVGFGEAAQGELVADIITPRRTALDGQAQAALKGRDHGSVVVRVAPGRFTALAEHGEVLATDRGDGSIACVHWEAGLEGNHTGFLTGAVRDQQHLFLPMVSIE